MKGALKHLFRLIPLCGVVAAAANALALDPPVLTWKTNSSTKLEQIIGDCDWDYYWHHSSNCLATTSATSNRFGVLGDGQLSSFESNGKVIVIGGDAISGDPTNHNLHAFDPIGYSTTTDPEAGFLINFYTNTDGSTVFVKNFGTNSVQMGGDDLPTGGITLPDGTYLFIHSGETNGTDQYVYSLLARADNTTFTNFTPGRVVSSNAYNGHFVRGALHAAGTNVCIFGLGKYRVSSIYLSIVPASNFWAGTGTLYYAGTTNGQPAWDPYETNAAPIAATNSASVGNLSVAWSTNLGLWLMMFDAGWNDTNLANGIYFTYAAEPWGPWAEPQLIFDKHRDDNALGHYIHKAISANNCSAGDGLMGPIIDQSKNPCPVDGEAFAPMLIERFITITNNTLRLYYSMGTFNPYTVVKMRSEFIITPVIDPASLVHKKNKFSFAWAAPTNESYQVDYSTNILSGWTTFTDIVTSVTGTFNFTNTQTGGLPVEGFYRLRTIP
jgi:hypothetical protein